MESGGFTQPDNLGPELTAIFEHIDQNFEEHVLNLRRWIQQKGISNTGEGMEESAVMVEGFFKALGCQETAIYQVGMTEWGTTAHPVVYARYNAQAARTLLIYWMYDTMPILEPDLWHVPPFEGVLAPHPPFPKVMYGRGAVNTKGPQMAQLNALMSIKAVTGTLPVNVIFVAEGDEERMSIGLRKFMQENSHLFAGAEMVYRFGRQNFDGRGMISGSSEGCLYFELETNGESWGRGPSRHNIHGGYKRVVDSPVWRHIKMLSTLVSEDGNTVLVDGWYDGAAEPTPEEIEHLERLVNRVALDDVKANIGVERLMNDMSPMAFLRESRYGVSFNVDGVWSGNMMPGFAGSILPHRIISKHNCRYPPEMDGLELIEKLRRHLDANGYPDTLIHVIGDVPYCKMNYHSDIGRAIMRMYEAWEVPYDMPPASDTLSAPYWPAYLFGRHPLQLPIAAGGLGFGANAHSPNEYYVIEGTEKVFGMKDAEKAVVMILYNLASV